MKNLRDLQLFNIVSDSPIYKSMDALYGIEIALFMFDMICSTKKNIALQSVAMQVGLKARKRGREAFHYGVGVMHTCKDYGLYGLHTSDTSVWITPKLSFTQEERYLLDPMNFEFHETPEPVFDNKDLILSKFSQHKQPLNYEFINKIQKVPFELDMDILINFAGKNMPITYNKVTAEYLAKPIYFKWQYDSRGRSYSKGYGLNIQGNKTVRAVLRLQNKEVINDEKPLLIALANARGFDHWTWERRIEWAKKQIIDYEVTIPKGTKYPEKYAKAVRAILDYREGFASGFLMELDATASGIQIMAAITGCKKTASEVNLTDPKRRKDVYRDIARKMNQLGCDTTKEFVKYPTMTH